MMRSPIPQPAAFSRRRKGRGGGLLATVLVLLAAVPAAHASKMMVPPETLGSRPPREDVIYVPQQDWAAVLKESPEGVFVPVKEYEDLYRRAREAYDEKQAAAVVPGDLRTPRIVEAGYQATIQDDVVAFEADFRVVQHHDDEQLLSLPLTRVRYQEALLNGEPAHIFAEGSQPVVTIPGPGSHQLTVRFLVPLRIKDKSGVSSFGIPSTPLNEVRVTAEAYYDIAFPGALFSTVKKGDETNETVAFLGQAKTMQVQVRNRRSSSVKDVQLSTNEHHRLYLSEDLSEHVAEFMVDVRNDKVTGVEVAVPKNMQVHGVSGKGIAGWARRKETDHDVLSLDFHIAVTGLVQFTLELYQYREDPQAAFEFADVRLLNVTDRQGQVSVYYDTDIRINVDSVRHLQPVAAGNAQAPAKPAYTLFRRYHLYNLPFYLSLTRAPVPRQTEAGHFTALRLDKERVSYEAVLTLSGVEEGTSRYDFPLAADYRVKNVQVMVNRQTVTSDHKHRKDEGRWHVDIWHPVRPSDQVVLKMEAERLFDQEQLRASAQELTVPHLTFAAAQRSQGTLRVEISDELLLEDITLDGYRPAEEFLIALPQREGVKAMTYQSRVPEPTARLTVSQRRAEQTSETVSYLAVDEDLLRANVYLRYQVTAGTQDRFYFAIPAWEGSKLNIEGDQIKEKKKLPLAVVSKLIKIPADLDLTGHDIWVVVLQKERDAVYQVAVEYQKKIGQFDSFQQVPLIVPLGVSNDTGYVVLEASKNTEITTEKQGLSEVETYEHPTWPPYKPSNRIIESLRYFTQPYVYRMAVKRMQELPVLAALVKRETLTYTFDTESQIFFSGTYAIRNTNQQYLQIDLPESFVLWGATVQGEGIKPRKGSDRQLYVPLPVDTAADIQLKITGQLPKPKGFGVFDSVKVKSPRLGMPVLESNVLIYYPQDYTLLSVKGNFEKLPKVKPKQPLLRQMFGGFFATVWQNLRRMFRFPRMFAVQGRLKSAADDIGDQFTAGNTSSISRVSTVRAKREASDREADEVMLEEKVADTRAYEPYYLRTDYDAVKDKEVSKNPSTVLPAYGRKKGLLSLSIDMPTEGVYVSAKKLWGDSRLRLTFLSGGRERVLGALVGLLFIALGFFVQARKLMTPFMYCVAVLTGGTIIPLIVLPSYVFLFNGAVAGALIFAALLWISAFLKKTSGRFGLGVWWAVLLVPLLAAAPVRADEIMPQEPEAFPDVKVYIPYAEAPPRELTGAESLFVPTTDYFRLKKLAEPPYEPELDPDQLGAYNLAAVSIDGKLEEDRLLMTARVDVFVNTDKDWVVLPLPFQGVFIEKMTLDGNEIPVKVTSNGPVPVPAQRLAPAAGMDVFHIPVYGAGYHRIEAVFHTEVHSQLGKKSVSFRYPGAHVTDVAVDFQRSDIFVEMQDKATVYFIDESKGSTVLKAAPAQGGQLNLAWFPRKYLKKSEKPLIYADVQVDMALAYDEVRIRQDIDIRVEKSSIASMDFAIPAGAVVEDVLSGNVRSWETVTESGKDLLRVQFKQEITDRAQITLTARRRTDPDAEVRTVLFDPQEAERARGYLNLFAPEGTRLQMSDVKGLTPAAVQSARQANQGDMVLSKSYSFLSSDFHAGIRTVAEERRITARLGSRHIVADDLLTSYYQLQLDIKKNKAHEIVIDIPQGHRVESVNAPLSSGYTLDGNQVKVPFIGGVKGAYGMGMTLVKEIGGAARIDIDSIRVRDIEKQTGNVSVFFPHGFDVTERSVEGLKPASARPAIEPRDQAHKFDASYGYEIRDTAYKTSYEITRKAPVIETVKVYHATVEDSYVEVKLLNLFTIKSSPVDHIDMIIPADISDAIDIDGDHINTVLKKPVGDGKQVAVRINLLTKVDRSYLLQVSFKTYFDQRQTFAMPQVVFPQARNRTEFISVAANTGYQVDPAETAALIEVEADGIPALPQGVEINDILWSYRAAGHAPWQYRLNLTRLAREQLVKANIVRQDVRALIIPSGYVLSEVVMRVNNRTRQFLPVQLPKEAELWSLKVAGESVKASRQPSDKTHDSYLIPLIKSGAGDRSFEIKLVYLMPVKKLGWTGRMNLGMLQTKDIPVEKTSLTVFVPENYQVGKFKTNTEEIDVSLIESEKILELAKEQKYWTSLASTSKGELRKKALKNRDKVTSEIGAQYEAYYVAQSDLQTRVGNKKFNQKVLQNAQTKNAQIVSEAEQIIRTNQAVPSQRAIRKQVPGKSYSQRRNVKGWNFKTGGYRAQDEVQAQVSNYLSVEDQKQVAVRQQQLMNVPQTLEAMPQQGMVQQFDGQVAYGVGGVQSSQYDPNMQVEAFREGREIRSDGRQRARGGFQTSAYDTRLGLIQGLGGEDSAARAQVGADRSQVLRDAEAEMEVMNSQVLLAEAPQEMAQEFWGGAPRHSGERAAPVVAPPASAPAPADFWGNQNAVDNLRADVTGKLDAPAKAQSVLKQSTLLRGYRSIDIPLAEQGNRFTFKKLGGNPTLTFSYRKRGVFARAGYLVLLLVGGVAVYGLRQMPSPFGAWAGRVRRMRWHDQFCRMADSNALLIMYLLVFLPALFSGLPLAGVMLGMIGVSILRRVTLWRCRKRNLDPPYSFKTFLHYGLSYIIVVCLFLSLLVFYALYLAIFVSVLNWIYVVLYCLVALFTPRVAPPVDAVEDVERPVEGESDISPESQPDRSEEDPRR